MSTIAKDWHRNHRHGAGEVLITSDGVGRVWKRAEGGLCAETRSHDGAFVHGVTAPIKTLAHAKRIVEAILDVRR